MGKPKDPDYWKKWRAAHPEYREREQERLKARQRGDRAAEREKAKVKAAADREAKAKRREWNRKNDAARKERLSADPDALERRREAMREYVRKSRAKKAPPSMTAEAQSEKRSKRWLELAEKVVRERVKRDMRDKVYDPLYDDALGEAILAIYSGGTVARTFERAERRAIEAVESFLRREWGWRFRTAPLLDAVVSERTLPTPPEG